MEDSFIETNKQPFAGQVPTIFRIEESKIVHPVQDSEAKKPYPVQQHVPL